MEGAGNVGEDAFNEKQVVELNNLENGMKELVVENDSTKSNTEKMDESMVCIILI